MAVLSLMDNPQSPAHRRGGGNVAVHDFVNAGIETHSRTASASGWYDNPVR